MSKYKYIVHDYHAIKKAEITIDGITVLSGINGCGKSTLSQWLYCIVNGVNEFDSYLFDEYREKLCDLIYRMQIACLDLRRAVRVDKLGKKDSLDKINEAVGKLNEAIDKLESIKLYSKKQTEVAQDIFLQALYTTGNILTEAQLEDIPNARKTRILSYLEIEVLDEDIHLAIENFIDRNSRLISKLTQKIYLDIEERPTQRFFESIDNHFNLDNEYPSLIQLKEDNVDIIEDEHISTLFNLKKAIYIDTPMSIDAKSTDNLFWDALHQMIMEEKDKTQSAEIKKFLLRIKDLLDGEAVLDEDDIIRERNLRYVSNDKKVNIRLCDVATGFKTFSYLQRLLENGHLNDETLLMIDEPEAHLHPQWIVEFARLLVLLNKKLGLKIMIASHNPDMVAAIHDIANKEGVLDNTNFYVAQPEDPDSHKYIYKDLGHDIGEIFESFNVAIEKINRYGAMDLQ